MHTNQQLMNYAIEFYQAWLIHSASQYLDNDEYWEMLRKEDEAYKTQDLDWYLRAVRKVNKIKHNAKNSQLKHSCNTEARKLGRHGEQLVVKALGNNKWKIATKPNKSLRPRYGNSTVDYDIVAMWKNNKPRHIEVKTISDNFPCISLHYRFKMRFETSKFQQKYEHHYIVFVWRNEIYYVRSKNLRYIAGIPNCHCPKYNYMWVVDPSCLKKIQKKGK